MNCNVILGHAADDIVILRLAERYLRARDPFYATPRPMDRRRFIIELEEA